MKLRFLAMGVILVGGVVCAQTQSPPPPPPAQKQTPPATAPPGTSAAKTDTPAKPASTTPTPDRPANVVEEIAARVNGDIVTSSDLGRAQVHDMEEAKEECTDRKCTPEETQKAIESAKADALRGLIDTKLLVQRAKDMDINAETELVRQLDETRIENKLDSMEALQKAVEAEGLDWEEYKDSVRNQFLAQDVIYREVGGKVSNSIDQAQIQKYYEEHKDQFVLPETVRIREILLSTTGKPESEWPAIKKRAEQLRDRVQNGGEDFGDLAKHFSDGSTKTQGGELGSFERGKLDPKFETEVFKLNRNEMTPVMQAGNGFIVIQVEQRYEAGVQPLDKIEQEVSNRIASSQMPDKLRAYLAQLRKDSFVEVRPPYVDTGATGNSDVAITEAKNPLDEPVGKLQRGPKKKKKFLIF
ncbi:MAG TPA: peptidylprolyl isomerase [Candidatus Acidoferrales bacterium]